MTELIFVVFPRIAQFCSAFYSSFKNRSNSATGIRMWRSARLGLISPRWINCRTDIVETPRYAAASLSFKAPTGADVFVCVAMAENRDNYLKLSRS